MKTFLVAVAVGMIVTLTAIVIHNAASSDCEQQYNAWSSETNLAKRDALFADGIRSGCFHYN